MINWIDINHTIPEPNKMYIIQFTEYLGVIPIYGFKLSTYTNSFDVPGTYLVTHYATIPEYLTIL